MKWRTEPTAAEMAEVRSCLGRLGAEAPSTRAVAHGPSLGIADSGADYALATDVDDAAGWRACPEHPSHGLPSEILRRIKVELTAAQFTLPGWSPKASASAW
jgi:hypothetical protein